MQQLLYVLFVFLGLALLSSMRSRFGRVHVDKYVGCIWIRQGLSFGAHSPAAATAPLLLAVLILTRIPEARSKNRPIPIPAV